MRTKGLESGALPSAAVGGSATKDSRTSVILRSEPEMGACF